LAHSIPFFKVVCSYTKNFSRIPFYYAEEATEAAKHILGPRYVHDSESFYASLWTTFNSCIAVEESKELPGNMEWQK
jgi:omega-6 fatty acid desaturase (delta-12 desaturase)